MTADRPIYRSGTVGLVHVAPGGQIRKTTSAGAAWIDTPVQNDGLITATNGRLDLNFGGGPTAATGKFGAPAQAGIVRFGVGNFPLDNGVELRDGTDRSEERRVGKECRL